MNVIDILIILFVLGGAFLGFRRGVITQTVSFVGLILIFIIAYLTKDYLAFIFVKWLPFIKIDLGSVRNLVVLNVLMYELIAFGIIFSLLMILFKYVMTFTEVFEAILKNTIVLALPIKILGLIMGAIQYLLISVIIVILLISPVFKVKLVKESKSSELITEKMQDKKIFGVNIISAFDDIAAVETIDYRKHDEAELQVLDIMLQNKITNLKLIDSAVESGKLDIKNIDVVLDKYRK